MGQHWAMFCDMVDILRLTLGEGLQLSSDHEQIGKRKSSRCATS
jgi:hypothetical protein